MSSLKRLHYRYKLKKLAIKTTLYREKIISYITENIAARSSDISLFLHAVAL